MRSSSINFRIPLLLLVGILLFTSAVRIRLLDVPLERDEGEYAYIGQMILDGIPPYQEAANMKFPGIYFLYAGIIAIFGTTASAIHTGLLIANSLSIIFLFALARSFFEEWISVASAGAFALLSMSYHVQGFWANAEHFILPFVIAAYLLLFPMQKKKSAPLLLLSGVLLSCATLIKQHGAFFSLVGFLLFCWHIWQEKGESRRNAIKDLGLLTGGFIIPLVLCFAYLASSGVLEQFYRWTFLYAKAYSTLTSVEAVRENFLASFFPLWQHTAPLWILAGFGFLSVLFSSRFTRMRLFILVWLTASVIAVSVGFYFRPHYFVLILPIVALFFGFGIQSLTQLFMNTSTTHVRFVPPVFIAAFSLLGTIAAHWDVTAQLSPAEVTRVTYLQNPFLYSERIAELIRERSTPQDRIAIIGNEPQILFYAQRRSATPFIYIYSLLEDQPLAEQFRAEVIGQLEATPPKLILTTHLQPDWYQQSYGEAQLNTWFSAFAALHYKPSARLEYSPGTNDTLIVLSADDLMKQATHQYWITIHERRAPSY